MTNFCILIAVVLLVIVVVVVFVARRRAACRAPLFDADERVFVDEFGVKRDFPRELLLLCCVCLAYVACTRSTHTHTHADTFVRRTQRLRSTTQHWR